MRAGAIIKANVNRARVRDARAGLDRARALAFAEGLSFDDLDLAGRREYLRRAVQGMEFAVPVARSIKTKKRRKR